MRCGALTPARGPTSGVMSSVIGVTSIPQTWPKTLPDGTRIWIITEADRSCTTLLLPEEY